MTPARYILQAGAMAAANAEAASRLVPGTAAKVMVRIAVAAAWAITAALVYRRRFVQLKDGECDGC